MNGMQHVWRGLAEYQVTTRAQNLFSQLQGSELVRNIEDSELARLENQTFFLKLFNYSIVDDTKEQTKMERMVEFGNPYLFYYLTNTASLYIDATFSVAPKPFYRCLVVVIFDKTL